VSVVAGCHLGLSVAYLWEHSDDGPQHGLLVLGAASEDGSLVARWGLVASEARYRCGYRVNREQFR
jgi:hypothetical protein